MHLSQGLSDFFHTPILANHPWKEKSGMVQEIIRATYTITASDIPKSAALVAREMSLGVKKTHPHGYPWDKELDWSPETSIEG